MNTIETLFSLIRSGIRKTALPKEVKDGICADILQELYSISAKHDLAHLVGDVLYRENCLGQDAVSAKLAGAAFQALYRCEQSKYELSQICQTLNNAQIPCIPLKGAVIRELYPESWMRTSCDIDILVDKADLEKAVSVLESENRYTRDKKTFHDISLYSPTGIHLELHFNIQEGIPQLDQVLEQVWQHAAPSANMPYRYELTNEFLFFHVVAHMAYHFLSGGCGIRPMIDLWLLENNLPVDKNKLSALLSQANLSQFYERAKALTQVWMEDAPHTTTTEKMEDYILRGGVYGILGNKVLLQQQRRNGKWVYFAQRIFLPYDLLQRLYPIIKKHPWLTPLAQVCRWLQIVFGGRGRRAILELSYNQNITKDQASEAKVFLEELGLLSNTNP